MSTEHAYCDSEFWLCLKSIRHTNKKENPFKKIFKISKLRFFSKKVLYNILCIHSALYLPSVRLAL